MLISKGSGQRVHHSQIKEGITETLCEGDESMIDDKGVDNHLLTFT
jgi:putative component of toxin-antitoxin plasmid stabilization module